MRKPKFCTVCGMPVESGEKFCGECGAALAQPSELPLDPGQTAYIDPAAGLGQEQAFDRASPLGQTPQAPLDPGQTAALVAQVASDPASPAGQASAPGRESAFVSATTAAGQASAPGQQVEPPGSAPSGSSPTAPALQQTDASWPAADATMIEGRVLTVPGGQTPSPASGQPGGFAPGSQSTDPLQVAGLSQSPLGEPTVQQISPPAVHQDRPREKQRLPLWIGMLVVLAACLFATALLFRPIQRLISINQGIGGEGGELLSAEAPPFSGPLTANDLSRQAGPAVEGSAGPAATALAIDQPSNQPQAQAAAPTGAAFQPAELAPAPLAIPPDWQPAACTPSGVRFWAPPEYQISLYEDTYQLILIHPDGQTSLELYCGPAEHSTELAGELDWWLSFQNGVAWGSPSYAETAIGPLAWAVGPNSKGDSIFTAVVGPNLNRHVVQAWGMAPKGEWEASVALFLKILQSGEYTQ